MKSTKEALKIYTNGQYNPEYLTGLLADRYTDAAKELKLADQKRQRAYEVSVPHVEALKNKIAELSGADSLLDSDLPALSLFDALQCSKAASDNDKRDIGLKVFTAQLNRLWQKDPMSSLSIKDVAGLREHYSRNYPKSRVAKVIEQFFPKVGYNTLPLQKLVTIASQIQSQADYNVLCEENGLGGNRPDQIKARSFIRSLLNMQAQEQKADPYDADMPNPETGQQEDVLDLSDDASDELTSKPGEGGSVKRVTAQQIENSLLAGEVLESADNLIRVNEDTDNVELWIGASNGGLETSISNIRRAIHDFLTQSGYKRVTADVYEVTMPNPNTGQQDPVVTTVDPADAAGDVGPDSETQPAPELDETPDSTQHPVQELHPVLETSVQPADQVRVSPTAQAVPHNVTMGPDSETQPAPELESDESIELHPSVVERQPGTSLSDTELGPDSERMPTPELESDEPIVTSREGPVASINDDYFINKKDASRKYLDNISRSPSKELLKDIANPQKWQANQLMTGLAPQPKQQRTVQAQVADPRMNIRNAVKGSVLKKRADVYQVGTGIVGADDTFHYTFGFDTNLGSPTKDQLQWFINDSNTADDQFRITSVAQSGPGLMNVTIKTLTTAEKARGERASRHLIRQGLGLESQKAEEPAGTGADYKDVLVSEPEEVDKSKPQAAKMKEYWDGPEKFQRELEAESAEELNMLHRSLNGEEVQWPKEEQEEQEAVDEEAKEYWEGYMGDYGKKLTEDDGVDKEVEKESLTDVIRSEKEVEKESIGDIII